MRLSISNIIWPKGKDSLTSFLDIAQRNGLDGIELALSCLWDEPASVSTHEVEWLLSECKKRELSIVSLHSLTFTRPDLVIFRDYETRQKLVRYLKKYAALAKCLDCQSLVFGSPKARLSFGQEKVEKDRIFSLFLQEVNCVMDGVRFNLEPLSGIYTDYMNNFDDALRILRGKRLDNIRIQLDLRTVIENRESLENIFKSYSSIGHVHVSNPGLQIPGGEFEGVHRQAAHLLKENDYDGYITAEVRGCSHMEHARYFDETVGALKRYYG